MSHGHHATTIRIRRARSADLNDVAELWTQCGLVPSPRGFRNEMERMLISSPTLCFVAADTADGGQIVGALLASYDGRSVNVSRLATRPAHRRRGVATALVARLTTTLDGLGAGGASVLVLDRTPDADRLWTALEYDHIGDVPAYRPSAHMGDADQRKPT